MLLVILHGFGDGKKALGELAGKIHLPGVACLVARGSVKYVFTSVVHITGETRLCIVDSLLNVIFSGEHRLPGEILPAEPSNEIGYFWYDNIDWSDGTTLPRGDVRGKRDEIFVLPLEVVGKYALGQLHVLETLLVSVHFHQNSCVNFY